MRAAARSDKFSLVTATNRKKISDNLKAVREKIAAAAAQQQARPGPSEAGGCDKVGHALGHQGAGGLRPAGYRREPRAAARAAREELELWRVEQEPPPTVRWHMVGSLQRNKVKACLAVAHIVHSVDSLRLAEEISLRAIREEIQVDCLLEVNCSEETQKSGVAVGAVFHLAEQIATLRNVNLIGLMTMAPLVSKADQARFAFTRLRELFEEIYNEKIGGRNFAHLSMGMSNDYEVAVEEGATMVRIGRALFE